MGWGIKLFILLLVTSSGTYAIFESLDSQVDQQQEIKETFGNFDATAEFGFSRDVPRTCAEERRGWAESYPEKREDVEELPTSDVVADTQWSRKKSVSEDGLDPEVLKDLRRFPAEVSIERESAAERYATELLSSPSLTVATAIWVTFVSFVTLGSASFIMLAVNSLLFNRLPNEDERLDAGNPGDTVEYTVILDGKREKKGSAELSNKKATSDDLPADARYPDDKKQTNEEGAETHSLRETLASTFDDKSSADKKDQEDDESKADEVIPADDRQHCF